MHKRPFSKRIYGARAVDVGVVGTVLVPWESTRRELLVRTVQACTVGFPLESGCARSRAVHKRPFSKRRIYGARAADVGVVGTVLVPWESTRRESLVRYRGISVGVGLCSIASGA